LAGSDLKIPPRIDQPEISLFGPGYGESVVVHLGNNEWMIVDSCIDRSISIPTPIAYLREIGVDTARDVKLIVATHWHDDHVRGLSEVVRECPSALFACSSALTKKEFLRLTRLSDARPMMSSFGVQEFAKIIEELETRKLNRQPGFAGPDVWTIADRLIWRGNNTSALTCEVYALSPSDPEVTLSLHHLAALFPDSIPDKVRIAPPEVPNRTAVVLWVRFPWTSILLGADLENTPEHRTGWSAIVDSTTRPSGRASVFKVPHHGSAGANNERIWSEMLDETPIAVLCPHVNGRNVVPKPTDMQRICGKTKKAYITAEAKAKISKLPLKVVEKTIKETVRYIQEIPKAPGQIRLRGNKTVNSGFSWTVELFKNALPLCNS
jgi:hypothetical protein